MEPVENREVTRSGAQVLLSRGGRPGCQVHRLLWSRRVVWRGPGDGAADGVSWFRVGLRTERTWRRRSGEASNEEPQEDERPFPKRLC